MITTFPLWTVTLYCGHTLLTGSQYTHHVGEMVPCPSCGTCHTPRPTRFITSITPDPTHTETPED